MINKVLIIDDDKEMCEEMAEILKNKGYDTSMAFDGLECKKLIEKHTYNILLLDLRLPKLNGLDILRSMKNANMKTKVLVLTGDHLISKLEEDTLTLADEVIKKPFDVGMVLGKIKELIGEGSR